MAWQKANAAPAKKDNSGALFKNKEKSKDTDPDYKGSVTVNGRDYWLASWLNEAKQTGEKYMSVKLTPKEAKVETYQRQAAETPRPFDDEVPF